MMYVVALLDIKHVGHVTWSDNDQVSTILGHVPHKWLHRIVQALVEDLVKFCEFHSCEHTSQADHLAL
jgi:hypothetical protein